MHRGTNPRVPERFFLDSEVPASGVVIGDALAHHIARSLRMRPGDEIVVVDESGLEHGVRLTAVASERVEGQIAWSRDATGEPRLRITVIQALPRERMDDCIDALVEAGAAEVCTVITERVVARPGEDRVATRLRRWQAVARESAQLAGRGMIPRVHAPRSLADALETLGAGSRLIACTFEGRHSLAELALDPDTPLGLCIGPEGGFGDGDLAVMRAAGAEMMHMGPRVLRTRYAGAIACALLLSRSGDLVMPAAPSPPA